MCRLRAGSKQTTALKGARSLPGAAHAALFVPSCPLCLPFLLLTSFGITLTIRLNPRQPVPMGCYPRVKPLQRALHPRYPVQPYEPWPSQSRRDYRAYRGGSCIAFSRYGHTPGSPLTLGNGQSQSLHRLRLLTRDDRHAASSVQRFHQPSTGRAKASPPIENQHCTFRRPTPLHSSLPF